MWLLTVNKSSDFADIKLFLNQTLNESVHTYHEPHSTSVSLYKCTCYFTPITEVVSALAVQQKGQVFILSLLLFLDLRVLQVPLTIIQNKVNSID